MQFLPRCCTGTARTTRQVPAPDSRPAPCVRIPFTGTGRPCYENRRHSQLTDGDTTGRPRGGRDHGTGIEPRPTSPQHVLYVGSNRRKPIFTNVLPSAFRELQESARSTTPSAPTSCTNSAAVLIVFSLVDVACAGLRAGRGELVGKGEIQRGSRNRRRESIVGMMGKTRKNCAAARSKNSAGQPTWSEVAIPNGEPKQEIESLE